MKLHTEKKCCLFFRTNTPKLTYMLKRGRHLTGNYFALTKQLSNVKPRLVFENLRTFQCSDSNSECSYIITCVAGKRFTKIIIIRDQLVVKKVKTFAWLSNCRIYQPFETHSVQKRIYNLSGGKWKRYFCRVVCLQDVFFRSACTMPKSIEWDLK